MAGSKRKKRIDEELDPQEKQELDEILEHLTESDKRGARNRAGEVPENETDPEEIIKKPKGLDEPPDDLEGMLEKITETSESPQKVGFWRRLWNFITGK